ncbi:MAG TPA: AraC family transcriptional regulator [Rhizomicrobium sp.]|nr:AraC family transcriptional regulator [Rhizomicrobium sp.]
MTNAQSYGDAFARRFGARRAPVFVNRSIRKSEVAVTYLCQEQPTFELSDPQPVEDAYMASVVLRDNPRYALWENGKPVKTRPVLAGETTFYDFKARPVVHVNCAFDALHFYLPRAVFDAVADDSGVARIGLIDHPRGHGVDDAVMRGLGQALLPAFARPGEASKLFVDHVTLAAAAHVAKTYGAMRAETLKQGGLAAWQERIAKETIDAHLDGEISPILLARQCGLSPGHFARAFRRSTGKAPHQWLIQRRVEKAKALLRDTAMPLADVAAACGFADQSHFTRVFARLAGAAPGQWRRSVRS